MLCSCFMMASSACKKQDVQQTTLSKSDFVWEYSVSRPRFTPPLTEITIDDINLFHKKIINRIQNKNSITFDNSSSNVIVSWSGGNLIQIIILSDTPFTEQDKKTLQELKGLVEMEAKRIGLD